MKNLIPVILGLLLPVSVRAGASINFSLIDDCPLGSTLSGCGTSNAGAYISNIVTGSNGLINIFIGLIAAMLVFYSVKLLLGSRDENTLTEVKMAYVNALIGAVLVGGAFAFSNTFATGNSTTLVVQSEFNNRVAIVGFFFQVLTASLTVANVSIQGMRLVIAQDEGAIDSARKRFFHGMVGTAICLLVLPIVDSFTGGTTVLGGPSGTIAPIMLEVFGIAQFALTIFGAVAVSGMIIAGVMLVISVDESLKDRAKKLITASIVSFGVVIASYGIISLFV
ncbi:MAG: hypothetical protein O2904_03785 [bacterium]|nr:hypothetical protein [bacterium]